MTRPLIPRPTDADRTHRTPMLQLRRCLDGEDANEVCHWRAGLLSACVGLVHRILLLLSILKDVVGCAAVTACNHSGAFSRVILLLQLGVVQAATHTVTPSSNWQSTVNNAASGDTFVFANGTYTGSCSNYGLLSISKDITLRAQYTGGAVLMATPNYPYDCNVLYISCLLYTSPSPRDA